MTLQAARQRRLAAATTRSAGGSERLLTDDDSDSTSGTSTATEEAAARQALTSARSVAIETASVEGDNSSTAALGAQSLGEMESADRRSVMLLTFLYILQGIPLGLAGSVPYILTSRHVTYAEQGAFSLVFWPFSVKLLWAPLVDAVYWRRFGRRKSWLIPVQLGLGAAMLALAGWTDTLLGLDRPDGRVSVLPLTLGFFALTFLAATQDIAVDGWALTMLSRRNVAWASGCNSVGQTAGYFIAYVLFLALESAEFCNAWLRAEPQPTGLVSLAGFLRFWGVVFLVTTVGLLFRRETDQSESSVSDGTAAVEQSMGVGQTYLVLARIVRLRPVLRYLVCLCLLKSAFAAADGMTGLKLIEAGVPKERLALLGVVVTPFQLVLPVLLSRRVGDKPLTLYTRSAGPRLTLGLGFAFLVWITPGFIDPQTGAFPWHYFLMVACAYLTHQVFMYAMFVSQMAFHAKVSDPNVGGTYMTLLNTVTNLAGSAPVTLLLFAVDSMSIRSCTVGDQLTPGSTERVCITRVDGYYVQSGLCFALGVVALVWVRPRFRQLECLPQGVWKVT